MTNNQISSAHRLCITERVMYMHQYVMTLKAELNDPHKKLALVMAETKKAK